MSPSANVQKKIIKIAISRHDFDGDILPTPGIQRAVHEAVELLRAEGHELIPFCPSNFDKLLDMWGMFVTSDSCQNLIKVLEHNPIDDQSFGVWYHVNKTPLWIKKLIAPLVKLKSPLLAKWILLSGAAPTSAQLRDLNKHRLDLIGQMLEEWSDKRIDVMIAPGFTFPAPLLGYPSYLYATCSYSASYNTLNFPVGSVPVRNTKFSRCLTTTFKHLMASR
jgi:Asp-tRNA(Asn)/Glu-tRNA(Gln) amidotransferase A subunit family amidase